MMPPLTLIRFFYCKLGTNMLVSVTNMWVSVLLSVYQHLIRFLSNKQNLLRTLNTGERHHERSTARLVVFDHHIFVEFPYSPYLTQSQFDPMHDCQCLFNIFEVHFFPGYVTIHSLYKIQSGCYAQFILCTSKSLKVHATL